MSILFLLSGVVFASSYKVAQADKYFFNTEPSEKILFILDFSNSMSDMLEGEKKVQLMLDTMENLLRNINSNVAMGLRVYGHKMNLIPSIACQASDLVVPIGTNNGYKINSALNKTKTRGMTPITYSLKQAVKYDFLGYSGKKHIILLTDGGENCDESPCRYVMNLIKYRKDIFIDVIAFNINYKDDLEQLKCTALVTNGKFYNVNTAAELAKSLKNSINIKKNVEAKLITH